MRLPIAASGRVDTVLNAGGASANSSFVNGIAVAPTNQVQVDTAAVAASDALMGGLRRKATGVLRVATSGGARRNGGLLVTDTGVVVVSVAGDIAGHVAGLPVTSSGELCVETVS